METTIKRKVPMLEGLQNPNPCDGGALCACGPGKYFVSTIPDNQKGFHLVAGPYATHQEALDAKRKAQQISESHDQRSFWWSWGVVHMPDNCTDVGILNKHNLI